MPESNEKLLFPKLNELIVKLWNEPNKRKSLDIAIDVADELMHIIGIDESELLHGEDALNEAFPNSKFKNQKMEKWYEKHPFFGGGRVALYHYKNGSRPIESYFYWLNESATKARISATTQLFANWEDNKLTMKPEYNVGIDFFLNADANALLMVLTNEGNLRVIEFSECLSNTQIDILNNISGCALFDGIDPNTGENIPFEPQRTIHRKLWDALELSEVNKNFYSGIADHFTLLCQHLIANIPNGISSEQIKEERKIFGSRLIGRLLFIWFLRKKGIINKDPEYFEIGNLSSSDYYEQKLKVLFFNTLNTPVDKRIVDDKITPYLNGGLFDAHKNDWADKRISFPEGWFESLYNHLNKFNFTTDESSPEYEQVAIDPEMLGRVFENLLASIVPETSSAANERKNKGAFYTPREIVSFMCKESLRKYLKNYLNNEKDNSGVDRLIDLNDSEFLMEKSTGISELWGTRSESVKQKLIEAINQIKILDPACGSGAFPIGLMQLLIKTLDRLTAYYDPSIEKFRLGKPNEKNDLYLTKLFLIKNTLYGSDLEPMAIEISKLRAWLSLIVDDSGDVEPLPNLDFNFVCANSLIHLSGTEDNVEQMNLFNTDTFEDDFEMLRRKFFNTHSREEKDKLKKQFIDLINGQLSEAGNTYRAKQLKSWNPFLSDKPALFFDRKFMFNIQDGFDIVIGNPPYIHFEDMKEDSKKLYKPLSYYQSYEARGDIYTLFYELGLQNLKQNGILCYITSNKWMRAGYGESLRDNVFYKNQTELLVDLGSGVFESATVDTNIIVIKKAPYNNGTLAVTLDHNVSKSNMSDFIKQNSVEIKFKMFQPWVILSSIEQSIKSKIEKYGTVLSEWPSLKMNRGILTGCNEAFVIDQNTRKIILDGCLNEEERNITDKLIRPILRGRDIRKNECNWNHMYLICTHNGYQTSSNKIVNKIDIKNYPSVKKYLDKFYKSLVKREDQGDTPYNLRSCAYMDDLNKPKILYSEIVRSPQFYFDQKGDFIPEASAFYLSGQNNEQLCAYLNSYIAAWIFKTFYAGGGLGNDGYRYKKSFLLNLRIPKNLSNDYLKEFKFDQKEIDYINEHILEFQNN